MARTNTTHPAAASRSTTLNKGQDARFASFLRNEALGQFAELASSDSEEEEDDDQMQIDDGKQTTRAWEENERDEAPYAYAGGPQSDSLATTTPPRAADFNQSARSASAAQEDEVMPLATTGGATTAAAARATEQHSQSRLEITTTSAVVRSARKVKQLSGKIGLQDGAIKGMQNSMATYIKSTKRAVEGKTGEVITAVVSKPTQSGDGHEQEDIVPATPTSQEDLTFKNNAYGH